MTILAAERSKTFRKIKGNSNSTIKNASSKNSLGLACRFHVKSKTIMIQVFHFIVSLYHLSIEFLLDAVDHMNQSAVLTNSIPRVRAV